MLKKIVAGKRVRWEVAAASALESTVVPAPLELVLIPLMQLRRERMWQVAGAALFGCIAGALCGYAAGYGFRESAGEWLISLSGGEEAYARAGTLLRRHGFWFVFAVGVTPLPFQIAMVAAGASGYSLVGFVTATFLARFLRYFGLAALVWRFGDAAEDIYRKHRGAATAALSVLAALWFLVALVL